MFACRIKNCINTNSLSVFTRFANMSFRPHPIYEGPVKACVFDWAGTVVDSGVFAPVLTFQKLFQDEGVPITSDEVRAPMGVHKRLHIQAIIHTPAVAERWIQKKGKKPTDDDAERIYSKSLTATLDVLPNNSHMIRGATTTINTLREKYGIKIGSSTGYTSEIMAKLKPQAAKAGYAPDCYVTSDLVPNARPSPAMIFKNMIELDIWVPKSVVKVDDTTGGIKAGLYAGCWTVGIAKTGNYVGLTEEDMDKMDPKELEAKVEKARKILKDCGAHFIIDTIKDLPQVIDKINERMALGLSP